jgi:hypothetical protein
VQAARVLSDFKSLFLAKFIRLRLADITDAAMLDAQGRGWLAVNPSFDYGDWLRGNPMPRFSADETPSKLMGKATTITRFLLLSIKLLQLTHYYIITTAARSCSNGCGVAER